MGTYKITPQHAISIAKIIEASSISILLEMSGRCKFSDKSLFRTSASTERGELTHGDDEELLQSCRMSVGIDDESLVINLLTNEARTGQDRLRINYILIEKLLRPDCKFTENGMMYN